MRPGTSIRIPVCTELCFFNGTAGDNQRIWRTNGSCFLATSQIEMLCNQVFSAVETALIIFIGQNIRNGRNTRIGEGLHVANRISIVFSLLALTVFWNGGSLIMRVFVEDLLIIAMASVTVWIRAVCLILYGISMNYCFGLSGYEDGRFQLLSSGTGCDSDACR